MATDSRRPNDPQTRDLRAGLARFEVTQRDAESPPRPSRFDQRRQAIRAEIDRNRRGDHAVPTWVLAVALVVLVAGITSFVIFG
jgi:hypothetical protein